MPAPGVVSNSLPNVKQQPAPAAALPENNKITAIWQKLSWNNFKRECRKMYSFGAEGLSSIGSVIQRIFAYFFPPNAGLVVQQPPVLQVHQQQPLPPNPAGQFLSPAEHPQAEADENTKSLEKPHCYSYVPSVPEPSFRTPETVIKETEAYTKGNLESVNLLFKKMSSVKLQNLKSLINNDLGIIEGYKKLLLSPKTMSPTMADTINRAMDRIHENEKLYRTQLKEISNHNEN